jgi:hypothetical protein
VGVEMLVSENRSRRPYYGVCWESPFGPTANHGQPGKEKEKNKSPFTAVSATGNVQITTTIAKIIFALKASRAQGDHSFVSQFLPTNEKCILRFIPDVSIKTVMQSRRK